MQTPCSAHIKGIQVGCMHVGTVDCFEMVVFFSYDYWFLIVGTGRTKHHFGITCICHLSEVQQERYTTSQLLCLLSNS